MRYSIFMVFRYFALFLPSITFFLPTIVTITCRRFSSRLFVRLTVRLFPCGFVGRRLLIIFFINRASFFLVFVIFILCFLCCFPSFLVLPTSVDKTSKAKKHVDQHQCLKGEVDHTEYYVEAEPYIQTT